MDQILIPLWTPPSVQYDECGPLDDFDIVEVRDQMFRADRVTLDELDTGELVITAEMVEYDDDQSMMLGLPSNIHSVQVPVSECMFLKGRPIKYAIKMYPQILN